ncbi:hypothetical protein SH501x_003789 [Pirellulaceae bacterium SH501]
MDAAGNDYSYTLKADPRFLDWASATKRGAKSYQTALFFNTHATSQRLQEWFTQNKQRAALKESCEFQRLRQQSIERRLDDFA